MLPKKNQGKKCSDNKTISLISRIAKIVACILSKLFESKIEKVIEKNSSDSGKVKALEMLLD
jgi:hypothetical protein